MRRIDRHRNILDFTLASLARRKWKNSMLVLVYSLIIFMLASVVFLVQSIKREASLLLQNSPEIVVQKVMAGRYDLIPLSYMETIGRIRGVQSVKGRLWGYYYDTASGANYTMIVPLEAIPDAGAVSIGSGVARVMGAAKGYMISLKAYDGSYLGLEVADILTPESELVSSDLIALSEEDFRKLSGVQAGYANDLILEVRNRKELSTIADKILRALPDTRPIVRDEIMRTYDAIFDWRGGLALMALSGALLAFIIFSWDRATGLSLEEKREIGILKGIGWETSDIIVMKFYEGAVISFSSFMMGMLTAYAHVYFASSVLFEPVLKGWSVLYPHFSLTPSVDAYQVVTIFFLAVFPYTISTIIPSWRAATVDPDSVMRL